MYAMPGRKNEYYLIESFGELWRMTHTAYMSFLRSGKRNGSASPRDYGERIGSVDAAVTSWGEEEYGNELRGYIG